MAWTLSYPLLRDAVDSKEGKQYYNCMVRNVRTLANLKVGFKFYTKLSYAFRRGFGRRSGGVARPH